MREVLRRPAYAAGIIVLAVLCVYANSFSGAFVFDDTKNIVENHAIRSFRTSITNPSRPLVQLTFFLNYRLDGLRPAGYHLFNTIVHALAAIVFFAVVCRTLGAMGFEPERSMGLALISALFWAIHPLNTESVTYISQRGESLMGLFYLLTLYWSIRHMEESRWWFAALAIGFCALGMATKEVMITAPLAVLVCAWFFGPRPLRGWMHKSWFLWTGLAATWLVLLLVMMAARRANELDVYVFREYTPWQYALTQSEVILHYLRLVFIPWPLCLDYSLSPVETLAQVWPHAAVVAVLLGVTFWLAVRRHPAGMPLVMAFLILAPTSSFVARPDLAFEHRMYLPLAALLALVVVGAAQVVAGRARQSMILALVACVMLALGFMTVLRNRDYSSDLSMWRDVVRKRPQNLRARNDYAVALSEAGQVEAALSEYKTILSLIPENAVKSPVREQGQTQRLLSTHSYEYHYVRAHANMGQLLFRMGRVAEAAEHYAAALRVFPSYLRVREMMRNALLALGVPEAEVEREMERRIRAASDSESKSRATFDKP